MTVGVLNSQQLRSICEDLWEEDADASAFGLHVSSSIKGPPEVEFKFCLLYTSPSPRDKRQSRMPSSA